MIIFVDTSALLALVDAKDLNHAQAVETWAMPHARGDRLTTSNYVFLETIALAQRRLGLNAVRTCHTIFFPLMDVVWIEAPLHHRAAAALLTISVRDLSLVDCVSFTVMRDRNLDTAFAFDRHFTQQGFICIPGATATN